VGALNAVTIYDPPTQQFIPLDPMPNGRWYPTVTVLPDKRALIIAGTEGVGVDTAFNATYQLWLGTALGAVKNTPVPFRWYPWVWVLPNGQILVHSRNTTRFLNNVDNETWSSIQLSTVHAFDRTYPHYGAAVLLPLRHTNSYTAKILITGGTSDTNAPLSGRVPNDKANTATCEILHIGHGGWRTTASMHKARAMHDCVLLPDGTVLAIGGCAIGPSDFSDHPVAETELFDPATETWTVLARISVPRGYHATAVLLPDGSVANAGRDGEFQPVSLRYFEPRLEIFKPPYFYKGSRPTLSSVPGSVAYRTSHTVFVTSSAGLRDVVLLRTGAVTHGNNMDQRMVTCGFSGTTGAVTVTMPPNGKVAPPGAYLMFAVDHQGRPSHGALIRIGA
jgi:hypothetical protein